MSSSPIYVFCIIDSGKKIVFDLESRQIFSISHGNIAAIVRNIPADENLNEDLHGYARFHEQVAERMMKNFTVLPMRLMTVVKDQDAVRYMLARYEKTFQDNFARLAKKNEFGLKVLWPGETVMQSVAVPGKTEKPVVAGNSPASVYFRKKFDAHKNEQAFRAEAEKRIAEIDTFFSTLATEKKLRKLQTDKLLLNASYLVPEANQTRFIQAFNEMKTSFPEYKYLFSGPWPPYNFIVMEQAKLETANLSSQLFGT